MALRQYIGARYVPKFYENGDWTANTAYEALTIVTRNGNSYTSKKPVPASVGAPENNPDYWVSTGIYNAQVEELREDIDDINDRLDTMSRTALYIGNSFTRGNLTDGEYHGIYYYSKDYFDNSYMYYGDGIGFVPYTGHTNTFVTLLQSAIASGDFDPADITDVVVLSAWGDTRAIAEGLAPNTGITSFVSYANANLPNLKHIYCGLAESRPLATDYNVGGIYNSLRNLYALHKIFKGYQGMKFDYVGWSGYRTMLNTSVFNSDDVHMTNAGYEFNANELTAGFNGNMNYYNANEDFEITVDLTAVFGGGNLHGFVHSTPDECFINFDRYNWASVPATFTPPARTDIFCAAATGNRLHFATAPHVTIPINTSFSDPSAAKGVAEIWYTRSGNDSYGFTAQPYADHFSGTKTTDGFTGFTNCNALYTD